MSIKFIKNLFYIVIPIFLVSCSTKNNIIDFDISDLPKPKVIKSTKKATNFVVEPENKAFIEDLDIFLSKDNVLSKFKIGKKDPFSIGEITDNQFSSDFELKGFLNTDNENFVVVSYLGNEGSISEDSVGGLNTNLLPNGAKVIKIDPKKRLLNITFDKKDFIFEF